MSALIDPYLHFSYRPAAKAGDYVVYWMQAAQRLSFNPALNRAADLAKEMKLPLLIVFCFTDAVPDANLRHYSFMLQGIFELSQKLAQTDQKLYLAKGDIYTNMLHLLHHAAALVCDSGYLRWQRELRAKLRSHCRGLGATYLEYETEAVVPVELASNKEEYSAATLRRKLVKHMDIFLKEEPDVDLGALPTLPKHISQSMLAQGFRDASAIDSENELEQWAYAGLEIDRSVGSVNWLGGGEGSAKSRLMDFCRFSLRQYATLRSDPSQNYQSGLSPYLHFGQISPVEISLRVLAYEADTSPSAAELITHKAHLEGLNASKASFLEELIVRRELSFNFCYYNPDYDGYQAIPRWARESLELHSSDQRDINYSIDILESGQTLDPYWNAAQTELLVIGKMHNYMRMYWGKKLIEWSPDPESAFYTLLYLNNRYSLDGRDPNSYAGVAWCFGKHDRPWQKRPVFGSVRYMNAKGLDRKFDMQTYLDYTDALREV